MKTTAATMRRSALVLCPFALALAVAPIAGADEPDPVEITSTKPFGPGAGDFKASGAIDVKEGEGSFANVRRMESAQAPGPNFVIQHLTQEFVSANGTFTMRVQIKETGDSQDFLVGSGRWVITKGTGSYEGIHGQGTVTGTADRLADPPVISRTYLGKVHQTPKRGS